jgi:RNA polymerase sigma-70 factor (ECF subfamily)
LPGDDELPARLGAVLEALVLAFNEGYTVRDRAEPVSLEAMDAAIRLAEALAAHPTCGRPATHAALALMLLQSSRARARFDAAGALVPLEAQDRSRWDRGRIARGLAHLSQAASGPALTTWHVQAGIAATHACAASWEATDWVRIASLYEALEKLDPSFPVRLNRAVAISMADGPAAGLARLEALEGEAPQAQRWALPAARADALRRIGRVEEASREYRGASATAPSGPERTWLAARAAACRP